MANEPHGTTPEIDQAVVASPVCTPCGEAIDWYVEALGATEHGERLTGPDGSVAHAEILLEGTRVMLADEWPDGPTSSPRTLGGSTSALFVYVDDVDALWERAVAAGAEVVYPLELQFYGDKAGRIRDPFGHTWGLGQHVEHVSEEEMHERVQSFYEDQADGGDGT